MLTVNITASKVVTKSLTTLIVQQKQDMSLLDQQSIAESVQNLKNEKEAAQTLRFENISTLINDVSLQRCTFDTEQGERFRLMAHRSATQRPGL